MPDYVDKIKLIRAQDRRVKLTETDKMDIRARHAQGEGIRSIARAYAPICSRRMVQFVIFPERYEVVKKRQKEHWREYYEKYGPTYHAQAIAKTRAYKKTLYPKSPRAKQ